MAKGQVSEEELSKGLKGIGDFGSLTPPRVRRDNPFRDSRVEAPAPEPVKTIEVVPTRTENREVKVAAPPIAKIEPQPVKKTPEPAARVARNGAAKSEESGGRKADIYTEPVTLKISPEMRDEVEGLARELQRAKTSKKERITANTVMRVAIRLITTRFELKPGQAPNDEEELYELVAKAFTRIGS